LDCLREGFHFDIASGNVKVRADFDVVDHFLLFLSLTFNIDFSQMVIIDTFLLPSWVCGLIVSPTAQSFFILTTSSIEIALGKLIVGVPLDKIVCEVSYFEALLVTNNLVLLSIVNTCLQKCRQEFKFLSLDLKLVALD